MRVPDLTLAVRNLIRRPTFAVTAILLLALGAAANAAVFSVVRGILLRPLPYQEPDRLVAVWSDGFVSNDDLTFWRDRTHSFASIAAVSPGWLMALVAEGTDPVKVTGARISDNFFTTLGVPAMLGRTIRPGDASPGAARVIVLSAALFAQQFGSEPRTIGRRVLLDGLDYEVIGVMPPGFEFREPGTDVWAPLPFAPGTPQHQSQFSLAFARLASGATPESARRDIHALLPAMRTELSRADDWARDLDVTPLRDAVVGEVRPTLVILLGAVGLILLLAAVNLGTLVLGRSIERARDMAVRSALGASRWRLLRQLVAEQAILAALGAVAGLWLAHVLLPVLITRIPPEMPRQGDITLDAVVFATVFTATVMISIAMALLPVTLTARPQLQPLLRQVQSSETPARRRILTALVAVQIALAIVLGIGAGLMLRTLWNLQRVDPGFTVHNVLTFRLQTTSRRLDLTRGLAYLERVRERVRALPGVTHLGAIQHLPMSGYNWTANIWPIEQPPAPGATPPLVVWRFIAWDYFAALGIPLRAGRTFTPHDRMGAPLVAIVNETFARERYGSVPGALGRRVRSIGPGGDQTLEIVGVTGDVRFRSLDQAPEPELYRPLAQTFMFPMAFVVSTSGDPAQLGAAVRQAALAVDSTVPVAELQTLASLTAGTLGRPRVLSLLLSVFAAAGLALGLVGVYGAVAYRVRQQEREFGIRLALGAAPDRVARGVLRLGLVYAGLGLMVGVPTAMLLSRLLESVVFGISSRDPLTFVALPLLVTLSTLLACAVPARRAARVDPVRTMRAE